LFDRLGGAPAVATLAAALVGRLQGDPELGHLFSPTAGTGLGTSLTGVLAVALGRPGGMAMGAPHARPHGDALHLSPRQFCLFAAHLMDVLTDAAVADDDVAAVMAWVQAARPAVVAGERSAAVSWPAGE